MIGIIRSAAVRVTLAVIAFISLGVMCAAIGRSACPPPGVAQECGSALTSKPPPVIASISPGVIADLEPRWSGVFEIGEAGTCIYAEGGAVIQHPCTGDWWCVPDGAVVAWVDPI